MTNGPFPAGAGMNHIPALVRAVLGSVPRRRGDEPFVVPSVTHKLHRSPQARG